MLVLSRTKGEAIVIDDDIEVTILDVRGSKVRLGITASLDIIVHRKEIYDAIKEMEGDKNESDPTTSKPKTSVDG